MFEETTAVNTQTATPAPAATAPEAQTSTAASQNTEPEIKEGQAVPYERFKQVNEAKKAAETKLSEREKEFETHKAGFDISREAMKDPVFRDKINEIVNLKNEGKLTAKQAAAAVETATTASENRNPEIDELKQSFKYVEEARIQDNVSRYEDAFKEMAKADGYVDESDSALLNKLTTGYLLQANPNAPKKYSREELKKAYDKAHDEIEGYAKRKTAGYVKEKIADQPPVTKTGTAGTVTEDVLGHAAQTKLVAQHLKARKAAE